jgi:sterol desaturase/sphingolipid hydroxylase (fatty acid hydroxylase superfamily)
MNSWGIEPKDLQTVLILSTFAVLFTLEARFARRKTAPKTVRQSYFANLGTLFLNDTLLSLLSVTALWGLAENFSAGHGMLGWIQSSFWKGLAAFILLDFVLYAWHWACHHLDCFWMFHRVHHSDLSMNVTTAFRSHWLEVFMTTLIKAFFLLITGVETGILLISELIITLFVMFHHANIRIPGERWLAKVIVVPHLHRIHHSVLRSEHDSNYGAIFSFWDRLFGTLKHKEPAALGIANVGELGVMQMMLFGFRPIRHPSNVQVNVEKMIQEAAYYRAEKRGFQPGYEFNDWFEAEKEILKD